MVYAIDAATCKEITHFHVDPRLRSVAFLPDGSRAFIPSESAGELNVVDAINHKLLQTIALPKGCRPMTVKVSPDGKKVYVSTGRAGTVCVLDSTSGQLLDTIKVGKRPWALQFPRTANASSPPTALPTTSPW